MEIPETVRKYAPFLIAALLIFFGVAWRLIPHMPNFAPIGAIALIAGLALGWEKSLWVVLGTMIISDFFLGFYSGMEWTYLGFLLIIGLGKTMKKVSPLWRVPAGAFGASALFFIVSNFGTWLTSGMYTPDFAGFVQCYVMALPFLKATILSDLLFTTAMLAAYEVLAAAPLRYKTVAPAHI